MTKNMASGLCLLPPAFLACDIAANYASVNVPLKRPGGMLDARTYLKKNKETLEIRSKLLIGYIKTKRLVTEPTL